MTYIRNSEHWLHTWAIWPNCSKWVLISSSESSAFSFPTYTLPCFACAFFTATFRYCCQQCSLSTFFEWAVYLFAFHCVLLCRHCILQALHSLEHHKRKPPERIHLSKEPLGVSLFALAKSSAKVVPCLDLPVAGSVLRFILSSSPKDWKWAEMSSCLASCIQDMKTPQY